MPAKLLRTPTARRRHHLPVLHLVAVLLLVPLSRPASASASTVVTHLPGFDGPLPFYLETGYVGVEEETGAELFYYFAKSERSPGTDPVILWLTGGPRCSGFSGFAFEVGPVKYVRAPYTGVLPRLVQNPLSWTKMASIIFLDSPVCSGFSYARDPKGCDVGDYSSSLQVQRFLNKVRIELAHCPVNNSVLSTDRSMAGCLCVQWFTHHPQYLSNPFYLGGDSYAGKVIPLIATYMSQGTEKRDQPLINLKGYLIGNPITEPKFDKNFQVQGAHGFGIISDQIYEAAMKNCKGNYVNPANQLCAEVLETVDSLISEIADAHVLYKKCVVAMPEPIDDAIRRKFLLEESIEPNEAPGRPTVDCFTYGYYLAYLWMNNKMTRDALRIKEGTVGEWVRCKKEVPYTQDMPSSIPYHRNLTTRGYRALVYSGDHDLQVPQLSTQAWIRSLNFSIVDDWRAWHLDGQAAGFTITYANKLTFATVKVILFSSFRSCFLSIEPLCHSCNRAHNRLLVQGGGHTAPEYQPEECFAMAQRWLDNKPL
ncbi:serine carboxypeptidase-like 7 isoform X4 [Triticum dicoccoides]|uniref:serine carboxypeptidase-like 7 isoform X4 n=1 Tax=Triticum dicoccoides TaxID=85692 RepID=UPI0018908F1D|nr:serine carboxypeptidase-like 7 isoform X4 [Triticum dicoccoides]